MDSLDYLFTSSANLIATELPPHVYARVLECYTFTLFHSPGCVDCMILNLSPESVCISPELFEFVVRTTRPKPDSARIQYKLVAAAVQLNTSADFIRFMIEELDYGCDEDALKYAASKKVPNVHLIEYLISIGCPVNQWAWAGAIVNGNFDVVRRLCDMKCPWDASIMTCAVCSGDNAIFDLLVQRKCPADSEAVYYAASTGNLHALRVLREQLCCQVQPGTSVAAAQAGHLDIIRYLYESGCLLCYKMSVKAARDNGQDHIVDYMNSISLVDRPRISL